ncbi:MAG: hypothetical protein WBP65_07050 [Candidatus Sulfotelmatobacter sp.]|jgi:hypothetical protein
MSKLFVVSYNNKTDGYGAPSGTVILLASNADEAKAKTEKVIAKTQWVSDVAEADHVLAMENDIRVVTMVETRELDKVPA